MGYYNKDKFMKKIYKYNRAFSLAEVLITLSIIGVIALLTVPTLKRYTSQQSYVTQLKKDYTIMNNALDYTFADDLTLDIKKVGGNKFFTDYMTPKFSAIRICKGSTGGCFASGVKDIVSTPSNAVILADGSAIGNNGMNYIIDINGPTLPNVIGADIFEFNLQIVKGNNIDPDEEDPDLNPPPADGKITNPEGWRFVPTGKTAEIIDKSWKIEKW